jgi:LPS-assembly protein
MPSSSTLNRKNSNLFGSINNQLSKNFRIGYDFSLDNDMSTIESNSINTTFSMNNFVTTFDFLEQRGEIGNSNVISNLTTFNFNESNSLKFKTRRNNEINLTEYYDFVYEYTNDCLTAAIKYNRKFYEDRDLKPAEDLFFTITFIPLTTYERQIIKRVSN